MQFDKVVPMKLRARGSSEADESLDRESDNFAPCVQRPDAIQADVSTSARGKGETRYGRVALSGTCEPSLLAHDGFKNRTALMDTILRVSLVAGAYLTATSALTLLGGLYLPVYGLGPVEMAILNAISIIFFVSIMLPFSLLSSWCLRYGHDFPVQDRIVDLPMSAGDAFEFSLAALESLAGCKLITCDTDGGIIKYVRSATKKCGRQEISIKLECLSPELTRLHVNSHPQLSAVQYLLFGYTLAVDGSQNKRNVEEIVNFLSS